MPEFKSLEKDIDVPPIDVYSLLTRNPNNIDGDKPAFIDAQTGTAITRSQLFSLSKRFAHGLVADAGLKRGDVVGVFSINQLDYAAVLMGVLAAGGRVSPINPAYTAKELVHQIQLSGASILILHPTLHAVTKSALGQLSQVKKVFVFGDKAVNGWQPYNTLVKKEEMEPVKLTPEEVAKETAYLCFSSGTTGLSKGVETTHRNLVANILQISALDPETYNPNEVFMGVLPFYHIYGLTIIVHVLAYLGATVVVIPRFDLGLFCHSVQKYKVTVAHVVPPIALLLAKNPLVSDYDFSSIKTLACGAAPLSKDLALAVTKRLGCNVIEGYGMTECSPVAHFSRVKGNKPGSIGTLVANMTAKIVSEEGKELGPGETGELWLHGPNVMKGYLKNPVATKNTIDADGYLHTGDIGYVDKDGYYYLVDRLKELIKYKGWVLTQDAVKVLIPF